MEKNKANNRIMSTHKLVYDEVADEYEARARSRSASSKQRVERFANFVTTGKTVLELGCAVGQELQNFSTLGFEPTGVELSPKMAAYAERRNPNAKIIVGDFATMSFAQMYDAVYAQAFIHLFPKGEAESLIQKVFSLLKPGGVVFLGTTKAEISKEGWTGKADYIGSPKRYRRFWTKEELERALSDAGFQVIDYYEELSLEGKDRMNITARRA